MHRGLTAIILSLAALAAWASAGGCTSSTAGSGRAGDSSGQAMRAVRLVVHPLTRLSAQAEDGAPVIIAHVQVLDAYGQTIKALGRVRVELYRPASVRLELSRADSADFEPLPTQPPAVPAEAAEWSRPSDADASFPAAVRDRVWDLDLSDPAENARRFDDLVTRTYVLRLGGAPEWLASWSRAAEAAGVAGDSAPAAPTLRVVFTLAEAQEQGADGRLIDDYRLSR